MSMRPSFLSLGIPVSFLLMVLAFMDPILAESQCYRMDDHFAEAEVLLSADPDPHYQAEMVWPQPGYRNRHLERKSVQIEKDVLHWTASGTKALTIHNTLDVYTEQIDALVVTLSVEGVSELEFSWRFAGMRWLEMELRDYCSLKLPVVSDGESHTYIVRLDNIENWARPQIVEGFQIKTAAPARVTIHSMELRKKASFFSDASVGTRLYYSDGEFRSVLYAHAPGRLRYRVTLPEHPFFTTGVRSLDPAVSASFQVTLTSDGVETQLFEHNTAEGDSWHEHSIDLSAYEGKEVEIELSAQSEKAGQTVLWSNPAVYERRIHKKQDGKPNILFYLVDALRADRLELGGYDRPVAPTLQSLAHTGVFFSRCYAHETCTRASMMSLHTGMDSMAHGSTCTHGKHYKEEPHYFPSLLRAQGYETGSISQNNYSPPSTTDQKMFSSQRTLDSLKADTVCEETQDQVFKFLEKNQDRPFYLYVHTMEVHDLMRPRPVTCPDPSREGYKEVWESPRLAPQPLQYDSSIAYMDYNFKQIYNKLAELDLLENTIIVFTSDHGSALGEHDLWEHAHEPWEHQIHIPLILSGPGIPSESVNRELVTLTDLSTTVLALAGIAAPPQYRGRNLLPVLKEGELESRPVFSFQAWRDHGAAVLEWPWKLLRMDTETEYLYCLESDPDESVDRSESNPEKKEHLRTLLDSHIQAQQQIQEAMVVDGNAPTAIEVDPAQLETLKALGYIN